MHSQNFGLMELYPILLTGNGISKCKLQPFIAEVIKWVFFGSGRDDSKKEMALLIYPRVMQMGKYLQEIIGIFV